MATLDRSEFIRDIKALWPHLSLEINAKQGLLHLEMAALRRFAQTLIDSGDREQLNRCFALAQKYAVNGNAKMRNAIDVSFVEDLEFRHWFR